MTLLLESVPQQKQMEADFVREMAHVIFSHLGYCEHDEKKIVQLIIMVNVVILKECLKWIKQNTYQFNLMKLWKRF